MKICYASREFFPFYYGGIGSHIYFQMRMLKEKGHDIVFITERYENTDDRMIEKYYEGIELCFIEKSANPYTAHVNLSNSYSLFNALDSYTKNNNASFDYIIFPDCGGESFFTLLNQSIYGCYPDSKVMIEIEGPMTNVAVRNKDYVDEHFEITKLMEEFCFANTRLFTSPTEIMWNELDNVIDKPSCEYTIAPNLVNRDFLRIESNPDTSHKSIFFMGRLEYRKGPDLLIEAFSEIVNENSNTDSVLKLAGRDQYWPDYGKTFQEHWVELLNAKQLNRIEYLQFVNYDELNEIFSNTWTAVFPSRWEPFGNVALESILAGVPVILPRGTGLEEIVGREYEYLFEAGNKEDLKQVLLKMLNLNNDEHKSLSDSLRKRGIAQLNASEKKTIDFITSMKNSTIQGVNRADNSRRIFEIFECYNSIKGTNSEQYEELHNNYIEITKLYNDISKFYADLELQYNELNKQHNALIQKIINVKF